MFVLATAVIAFLFFPKNRESKPPSQYTYSCFYYKDWTEARCVSKDERNGACYGHYDLVAKRPEDGIKINVSKSKVTTCEGFTGNPQFYYDQSGRLAK